MTRAIDGCLKACGSRPQLCNFWRPQKETSMLQISKFLVIAALGLLASCSSSIDMPRGTSKGFSSARIIQRNSNTPPITDSTEKQIHGMIQRSLAKQFTSHNMTFGKGNTDLIVAYMVIYQENGMTADFRDYFGYGRDADEVARVAHNRGVLDNKRPDDYRQAGILIDVIDARTNKLVYRNLAKGDVVRGASASTRSARIDAAVAQALAEFFR